MKSSADEITIDLNELAQPVNAPIQTPVETATPVGGQSTSLPDAITELIKEIPATLQSSVMQLFVELDHLLKYLDLIREDVERERTLHKAILIFGSVEARAETLVQKVNHLKARVGEEDGSLFSTLEGIEFSFNHELRRVFGEKILNRKGGGQENLSRAEIVRAYGILHNCFQQSTIVLAQVFDPLLDGKAIFEDYKLKLEQSVILYRELTILLQKLRKVDGDVGILQKTYFINSLKQFQRDTMHFLMHRDWEEFEEHVRDVCKTFDEMGDLAPVFHKLSIYLETLLTQVSLRTVLKEESIYAAEMIS